MLYLLRSDRYAAFTSLSHTISLFEYMNFFCNGSLRNLKNVLQRNLRTDRAREHVFTVSGCTHFGSFSGRQRKFLQTWYQLLGLDVCTGLPEKLWIGHGLTSLLFYLKNEPLLRTFLSQIQNVCVCAPAFSKVSILLLHGILRKLFIEEIFLVK